MSIEVRAANIGGLRLLPEAKYTDVARNINPEKITKTQTKLINLYNAVKTRVNYNQLHSSSGLMGGTEKEFSYVDGYMRGVIDGMGLTFDENDECLAVYNSKTVVLVCEKPDSDANKIIFE